MRKLFCDNCGKETKREDIIEFSAEALDYKTKSFRMEICKKCVKTQKEDILKIYKSYLGIKEPKNVKK